MHTPRSVTMTTPSGVTLNASEWPFAGDSTCVLLHGFGHDGRTWDPLSSNLGDNRTLAIPVSHTSVVTAIRPGMRAATIVTTHCSRTWIRWFRR